MPGNSSDAFNIGKSFGWHLLPLDDGRASKAKPAGDLGHKPVFRSDEFHAFGHSPRLPQGSGKQQANCLPTGCDAHDSLLSMERIGHRIAKARLASGLSQRELARAIDVSFGAVGQWESHKKKPDRENLMKIAKATLVTAEYLAEGTPVTGVMVTDLEALQILRGILRMSPRQRKNAAELFGMAGDIIGEMEQKSAPAKAKQTID